MKCLALLLLFVCLVQFAFSQDWARELLPKDGSAPAPELMDTLVNKINRAINSTVPDLPLQDALTGKVRSLASLRGKVVLISTWNRACAPCLGELPDLKKLQSTLESRGFVLVTLSPDDAEMQRTVFSARDAVHDGIAAYLPWDKFEYPFQSFIFPSQYMIDREGKLREFWHGATSFDDFSAKVQKYL